MCADNKVREVLPSVVACLDLLGLGLSNGALVGGRWWNLLVAADDDAWDLLWVACIGSAEGLWWRRVWPALGCWWQHVLPAELHWLRWVVWRRVVDVRGRTISTKTTAANSKSWVG